MYVKKNGYTPGALLFLPVIKKLREHVEFEKLQCRILIDNEHTREMRLNTENHPDKIYKLRYNNEKVEKLTALGRKNDGNKS